MIVFRNEDCLKTIESIKQSNKKIDLVVTSPPYNGARNNKGKNERSRENHEDRYDVYEDNKTNEEYYAWILSIINGIDSILVKNGVILWNQSYSSENPMVLWELLGEIHKNTNFMIADVICWKKGSALPNNTSSNRLTRIWEPVFVLCRKDEYATFNANKKLSSHSSTGQAFYENVFNFFEAANNDGSNEFNKATYSSEMVVKLLKMYAREGSVVYDPFMGTGTTGIAVYKYGNKCSCIGSEISPNQVAYAKNRLSELEKKEPIPEETLF
jgi:DNA modification methylase